MMMVMTMMAIVSLIVNILALSSLFDLTMIKMVMSPVVGFLLTMIKMAGMMMTSPVVGFLPPFFASSQFSSG